jgi:hypothetical protein
MVLIVTIVLIALIGIGKAQILIEKFDYAGDDFEDFLKFYVKDFKATKTIKDEITYSFINKLKKWEQKDLNEISFYLLCFANGLYRASLPVVFVSFVILGLLTLIPAYSFEIWHLNAAIAVLGFIFYISEKLRVDKVKEYYNHFITNKENI